MSVCRERPSNGTLRRFSLTGASLSVLQITFVQLGLPTPVWAADEQGSGSSSVALSSSEAGLERPHVAPPLKALIDLNGYWDTRNFTVMTVNLLANLPWRFQYFSFTNHQSESDTEQLLDLTSFYSEQNLRFALHPNVPIDATSQWVIRSGDENDMWRLGVRWRTSSTTGLEKFFQLIRTNYNLTYHFLQLDYVDGGGYRTQLEHAYRLSLIKNRVYVAGFVDHTLWLGGPEEIDLSRVVTEHQLGVRVAGGVHIVSEYRYNEFLPGGSRHGVGLGLQYVIPLEYRD